MTNNPSFRRKVIYLLAIALLLIPLSFISRPATTTDSGGKLAQMREENNLSASSLGDVDPAGATMQLATFGLRGPAATILWQKAFYYKKTENWDQYASTLNQISKIQPHFVKVWSDLAWNLSYNISVEFDDYEKRYLWVKKGCSFFIVGRQYNRHSPLMLKEIGMFFGHKFGRSDERIPFRRMFARDTDFHNELRAEIDMDDTHGANGLPDNWLVAWLFYKQAEEVAAANPNAAKGDSYLLFYSKSPMQLIAYADVIEEDGYFGEKARAAWRHAGDEWRFYGNRLIPTTWGVYIQLNNEETLEDDIAQLRDRLDILAPGVREQIEEEKRDKLPPDQREALDLPEDSRTNEQEILVFQAEQAIQVSDEEVADLAPSENRSEAHEIAEKTALLHQEKIYINRYRDIVNFKYWRTRCEAEQDPQAIAARRLLREGKQLFEQAIFETYTDEYGQEHLGARECYEMAFDNWAVIFAKDEDHVLETSPESEDLIEPLKRYLRVLDQLGEDFPLDSFPLMNVIEINDPQWFEELQASGPTGPGVGSTEDSSESESDSEDPLDAAPTADEDNSEEPS